MKISRLLSSALLAVSAITVPAHMSRPSATLAANTGVNTSLSGTVRVTAGTNKIMSTVVFPKVFAAFNRIYPNVKIDFEPALEEGGVQQKLITQLATGAGADVVQLGIQDLKGFVNAGVLENLGPYMKRDGVNPNIYFPSVYKAGTVNGSPYMLDQDYATAAVFYNKDLFDKAKLPYPSANWTWTDLVKDAQKLTVVKGGRTVQYGFSGLGSWMPLLEPLIHEHGGRLFSPDGKTAKGYMNSPQVTQAIQFIADLQNKYHVTPTAAEQASFANVDMFATGKVAIYYWGPWYISTWQGIKGFHFGAVPVPAYNGKRYSQIMEGGYALNAHSNVKEAAWQLLKFMTTEPGSRIFGRWALPGVQSVSKQYGVDTDPIRAPFADATKLVPQQPDYTSSASAIAALVPFGDAVSHVLAHPGSSIQDALNSAADQSDQVLTGS